MELLEVILAILFILAMTVLIIWLIIQMNNETKTYHRTYKMARSNLARTLEDTKQVLKIIIEKGDNE